MLWERNILRETSSSVWQVSAPFQGARQSPVRWGPLGRKKTKNSLQNFVLIFFFLLGESTFWEDFLSMASLCTLPRGQAVTTCKMEPPGRVSNTALETHYQDFKNNLLNIHKTDYVKNDSSTSPSKASLCPFPAKKCAGRRIALQKTFSWILKFSNILIITAKVVK